MRTGTGIALLLGCAALPGCAAGQGGDLARPPESARWADCYLDFQPSVDAAGDLARLTGACAASAGLVAVTPIQAGDQSKDDPPERFTFTTRRERCYRAFAVGAPEVEDLDIAVKDQQGSLIAGDLSRDRFPVVPPRGLLCAPRGGRLTIEIGVAEGRGAYLLQIWGTRGDGGDEGGAAEEPDTLP